MPANGRRDLNRRLKVKRTREAESDGVSRTDTVTSNTK